MALDKHQIRQVQQLAREQDIPREEALEQLFPDEVEESPRPRKAPAKKTAAAKEPTGQGEKEPAA